MCETVEVNGTSFRLRPEIFFHSAPITGTPLYNNVAIHHGLLQSMRIVDALSGLGDAGTLYGLIGGRTPKEKLWESIRANEFADRPSRINNWFLVGSRLDAEKINQEWFPMQSRNILCVRVIEDTKVFPADGKLLNGNEDMWVDNARRYWGGERTAEPIVEYIVEGSVYFPDWRSKPFGIGAGLAFPSEPA